MQLLDGNCGVVSPGAILSEEELAAMSPTAAAVAKVVKPGMKLTEVSEHSLSSSKALGCHQCHSENGKVQVWDTLWVWGHT